MLPSERSEAKAKPSQRSMYDVPQIGVIIRTRGFSPICKP